MIPDKRDPLVNSSLQASPPLETASRTKNIRHTTLTAGQRVCCVSERTHHKRRPSSVLTTIGFFRPSNIRTHVSFTPKTWRDFQTMGLCCSSSKRSALQQHEKDARASSTAFSSPNTKVTSLMVADSPEPHNAISGNTESSETNPASSESTESTDGEASPCVINEAPPRRQPPKTSQQATKRKPKRSSKKKKQNDTSKKGPLAAVKLEKSKGTTTESIQSRTPTDGTTSMVSNFRKLKLQENLSQQQENSSQRQKKRKNKLDKKKGERKDEKKKSALWSDFESIQQKVSVQYELKTKEKASTSKKSKQSNNTSSSGKPPLTPSSKAKQAEALFDLKGSDTWYVDFKATPDAQSVRSQANLSLLSENSLEVQRQLYAEKRQIRRSGRGGGGPSSPARSAGHSSLMEIVQQRHCHTGSVAASADYGPVRRHRRGGSSAHPHDEDDTAHRVLFTPDYVDVDDQVSVVSDLADEDVDDLLEEDNAVTPYDHAAIVQQRLDVSISKKRRNLLGSLSYSHTLLLSNNRSKSNCVN